MFKGTIVFHRSFGKGIITEYEDFIKVLFDKGNKEEFCNDAIGEYLYLSPEDFTNERFDPLTNPQYQPYITFSKIAQQRKTKHKTKGNIFGSEAL